MRPKNSLSIRELPLVERPREKLLARGVRNLEQRDLIAILLNSGTRSLSALALADLLLAQFRSLPALAEASVEELIALHGIGEAKAVRLSAAFELGRRVHRMAGELRPTIRSAQDAVELLQDSMRRLDREEFRAILLDVKNRVLEVETISVGHLTGALVHPREVFKKAIRRSSAAVILVHNHPSGDPTPSVDDIRVTRRLVEAGKLLGIDVLDHIILGDSRYTSLKEQGYVTG